MGAGASAADAKKYIPGVTDEQVSTMKEKMDKLWPAYEEKMKKGGKESESDAAINAFKYNFSVLCSGASTTMPESTLESVESLPEFEKLDITDKPELLKQTVVLKLNGGLGTGMGLDKAKSLLKVNGDNTFLDLIAQQVESMKSTFQAN